MNTENGTAGSAGAFTLTADNLYTVVPPWISMIGGLTQFERWVLTVLASFRDGFWGSRQYLALRLGCDPESQRAQVSRAVSKLKSMGIVRTVSEGRRQTLRLDSNRITELVTKAGVRALGAQDSPITEGDSENIPNADDHTTNGYDCGKISGKNGGKMVDNLQRDKSSHPESVTNRHTGVTIKHRSVTNSHAYIKEDISDNQVFTHCGSDGLRREVTFAFGVSFITVTDSDGRVLSARPCTPEEAQAAKRSANDRAFHADAKADADKNINTHQNDFPLKALEPSEAVPPPAPSASESAPPSSPLRPLPSSASASARKEGGARLSRRAGFLPPVPTHDDVTRCLTDVYRLPYSEAFKVADEIVAHYTSVNARGQSRNWRRGYGRVTVEKLPSVCKAWAFKWRESHGKAKYRGGITSRPASQLRDADGWYYPASGARDPGMFMEAA